MATREAFPCGTHSLEKVSDNYGFLQPSSSWFECLPTNIRRYNHLPSIEALLFIWSGELDSHQHPILNLADVLYKLSYRHLSVHQPTRWYSVSALVLTSLFFLRIILNILRSGKRLGVRLARTKEAVYGNRTHVIWLEVRSPDHWTNTAKAGTVKAHISHRSVFENEGAQSDYLPAPIFQTGLCILHSETSWRTVSRLECIWL